MQFSAATIVTIVSMASLALGVPVADPIAEPAAEPSFALEARNTSSIQALGYFRAFNGDHCDGPGGDTVQFSSGKCIYTPNRHSFSLGGCDANIILWTADKCGGDPTYVRVRAGTCFNVNTGKYWTSATASCV